LIAVLVAFGPALVFILGSAASDMVAATSHDPIGIWQVMPFAMPAGSWPSIEAISTALFLVGLGLARAKAAIWWVALVAIAAGAVSQAGSTGHGAGAITAVALGAFLVTTRSRYDVPVGRRQLTLAAGLIGVGALALPASVLLGGLAIDVGLIVLLDVGHDPRPAPEQQVARSTLEAIGRGALVPYQLGPEATPVANLDGTAALAYARAGRQAVVLGDPAGLPTDAVPLFDAWVEDARRRDWQPVVYQASPAFAASLRSRGWSTIRVGDEAIVNPTTFDLRSPRVANLRHTITRSKKGGIAVSSSMTGIAGLPAAVTLSELRAVDAEWRRTAGPSLGFTVGRFDPAGLDGCLTSVAVDEGEQVKAFVVLRPTGDGWMVDVMRRRRAGPPGSLEACLAEAVERIAAMGATRLSLGLVPLGGLDPTSGPLEERALAVAARVIRPLYDVAGLRFFKAKLAPAWEPRFLAVRHRWGYGGAAVALLRLHLGGSWPRVLGSLLGRPPAARSRPTSALAQRPASST
jgi:lysylphosphatidylglycerol synthetase-like protein (DUF2156 family)